jgi:hypothetical protein
MIFIIGAGPLVRDFRDYISPWRYLKNASQLKIDPPIKSGDDGVLNKKEPPCGGSFAVTRLTFDAFDFRGFFPFGRLDDFKLHPITFVKGTVTFTDDFLEVGEYVPTAVFLDETIAFAAIKPLHFT